jgi:hypothetical protein
VLLCNPASSQCTHPQQVQSKDVACQAFNYSLVYRLQHTSGICREKHQPDSYLQAEESFCFAVTVPDHNLAAKLQKTWMSSKMLFYLILLTCFLHFLSSYESSDFPVMNIFLFLVLSALAQTRSVTAFCKPATNT